MKRGSNGSDCVSSRGERFKGMQNAQLDMVTPLRVRPYCVIERSKQMRTVRRDVNDSGENDFYFFIFYYCIAPMYFPPRKIRAAFLGESRLRQSRATQPTVHAG